VPVGLESKFVFYVPKLAASAANDELNELGVIDEFVDLGGAGRDVIGFCFFRS